MHPTQTRPSEGTLPPPPRQHSAPVAGKGWTSVHGFMDGHEVIDIHDRGRALGRVFLGPTGPATTELLHADDHEAWVIRAYARSIAHERDLRYLDELQQAAARYPYPVTIVHLPKKTA